MFNGPDGGAPPAQGQGGAPPAQGQGGAPPAQGQGGAPPAQGQGAPPAQGQGGAPPAQGQGGAPPAQGQGGAPPAQGQGGAPPAQGQGGAPPAQGQGGAPAPAGPDAGAGGAPANAAAGGDADIDAELERRADPQVKTKWADTLTRIDTFRIQSLQFSYNPTSIWHNVWQTLIPTDNIVEHWRQAFTNNPYGAGTDPADKWQAGLEGLRGVVRLLGDIAGAVANWTGILSGISAALALITSETVIGGLGFGAIAVILGQISTIANAVKVMTDLLDMIIGVIQMIILAQRIKKAPKGSAERARLLMLMKKESADFSNAMVNAIGDIIATAISAMTMGIGSGAGAAAGDGAKAALKEGVAAAGAEVTKLINPAGAIEEAVTTAKVTAEVGARVAELTAAQAAKGITPEAKLILQLNIDALLLSAAQITKGGVDHVVDVPGQLAKLAMKKAVAGAVTSFAGGALYAVQTGKGKAASSMTPTGAGPGATPGNDDGHQSIESIHLSAWPSLMPPIGDMRGRLQNAKIRMKRQFELAKGEVNDPAKLATIQASIDKIEDARTKQKSTAGQQQGEAQADANTSQQQVDHANQAQTTQQQLQQKADQTKAQAQTTAANPTLNAKPTGLMAWIGGKLADLQNWLLTKMLSGTDVTPEEASAAGISVTCLDGHHNDQQAADAASDAESNADELTKAVQKVRTGKDADLDYAMQSMADAEHWMLSLDDMDQSLAKFETQAAAYIAAAREHIRHERALKKDKQNIDAELVAPIIDGATDFTRRIAGDAQAMHDAATAAAGQGFGQLTAKTKADISQPIDVCGKFIDADVQVEQGLVQQATAQAAVARDAARALIGGTDYNAVPAMAQELEKLVDSYNQIKGAIQTNLSTGISQIINSAAESLAQQLRAMQQQQAAPGAPGANPGQPGANPGQPGANPGQPGANPGQPGANPGQPGANPGGNGAPAPGGSGTAPTVNQPPQSPNP
jgi:hypothetical protein